MSILIVIVRRSFHARAKPGADDVYAWRSRITGQDRNTYARNVRNDFKLYFCLLQVYEFRVRFLILRQGGAPSEQE